MYSTAEGKMLVNIARESIKRFAETRMMVQQETPKHLHEKRGVFVTLLTHPEHNLRGCIGFIEPTYSLGEATVRAAIAAAFEDPRFPPLIIYELGKIVVEVTVLSPPELLTCKKEDYKKHIKIGKHGLIVERGFYRGLLLPQVAVEYKWNAEEFLSHTCTKAGLPSNAWREKDTNVSIFSGQIFSEKTPNGDVEEKRLR